MNSLEDILGINFAEVLKQTVDFNHALGKCNPGENSPFSASTVRLELNPPPPRGDTGTSIPFLKNKPADISSDYVLLLGRCWGIFLLSKAHFISGISGAL